MTPDVFTDSDLRKIAVARFERVVALVNEYDQEVVVPVADVPRFCRLLLEAAGYGLEGYACGQWFDPATGSAPRWVSPASARRAEVCSRSPEHDGPHRSDR